MQAFGALLETGIGLATSEFGTGIPVAANGVDNLQAGLRELWTGQYVQTYTSQAIQWSSEDLGASPSTAYNIGQVGNAAIGVAGTLGAGVFNDAEAGSWALNGLQRLLGGTAAGNTTIPEAFAKELQGGGSWLMTQAQFRQFAEGQALIGRAGGQFMTSAARMNLLIEETGGDPVLLGQKLGVPWQPGTQLIRMDVSNPLLFNPRLPSASMAGANSFFVPGGSTVGGVPEIVTDQLPWQEVWATPITSIKQEELQ